MYVQGVILEFGKNKIVQNSRLNVAFRIFFQIFNGPIGLKIRGDYVKKYSQVGHTCVQVGHMYVHVQVGH